ncbi:unnamed protein product [Blepharisma stoltei]|uniref:Uncharacterized protein n=1 Tax=Blepharisma stoltei TaxID=1481888 RepID=A0AAU9IL30_9CILI|nr:unnamed protein product [Blepharisma stoltei]
MRIEESSSELLSFNSISTQVLSNISIEQYKELNTEFKTNKNNELLNRMILRLLIKKVVPAGINRPLHLIISKIIDEFMFDELEFALWTIYLENISWKRAKNCNEDILRFAAFKAKLELDNAEPYFTHLSQKYPNFKLRYQKWTQKNKNIFAASISDMNNKFKELTAIADLDKELEAINFAFFSEYIMRPPEFNFEDEAESNEDIENRSGFDFQSCSAKKYIKINDEIEESVDLTSFRRSSSIEGSTSSSEDNDSELLYRNSHLDWDHSVSKKDNF